MSDWKDKLQDIKKKILSDMEPPAESKKDNKAEKALGTDAKGNPIYKVRKPLQAYDHNKLDDPQEMERFLDHVEDSVENTLSNLFGSGGKAGDPNS